MIECDVADDGAVRHAVDELAERMPVLDGLVHSIAWAPAEDLQGSFVETSRAGFAAGQRHQLVLADRGGARSAPPHDPTAAPSSR